MPCPTTTRTTLTKQTAADVHRVRTFLCMTNRKNTHVLHNKLRLVVVVSGGCQLHIALVVGHSLGCAVLPHAHLLLEFGLGDIILLLTGVHTTRIVRPHAAPQSVPMRQRPRTINCDTVTYPLLSPFLGGLLFQLLLLRLEDGRLLLGTVFYCLFLLLVFLVLVLDTHDVHGSERQRRL